MRRLWLLLPVVVVALAACGPSADDACGTSYIDAVTWKGTEYRGHDRVAGRFGDHLGDGRKAGDCGGHPVQVLRLEGVPPEIAVGVTDLRRVSPAGPTDGGAPRVYVGEGFATEARSHPLHRQIYGDRRPTSGSCGGPVTVTGTVITAPPNFAIRTPRGDLDVDFRARARVSGFDRFGVPYFKAGDVLVASGRRCQPPSSAGALFVTAIRRG